MSQETKTITLNRSSDENTTKRIANENKLGWELVNTSVNSRRGSHRTTITFKRDTEIKFYERKKQLGENIDKLEKIADDYLKRDREIQEKKYNREIFTMILGLIPTIIMVLGFIGAFIYFVSSQIGYGFICLVVAGIILAIKIYLKKRPEKKSNARLEYEKTLNKIQNYYDESEKLGKEE